MAPFSLVRVKVGFATAFRKLPKRLRLALVIVAIQLAIGTLFRIIFLLAFRSSSADVSISELLEAGYLGFKFDLRLALLICLPLFLLSWIPVLSPIRVKIARYAWLGYFVAIEVFFLFMYFVDFGHYAYLGTRLNAGLLEHLQPLAIAAQMFWETYPVVWGLLGLAILGVAYAFLIFWLAFRELSIETTPMPRLYKGLAISAFLFFYGFGIYGNWSWYPLRWSAAYFSTNGYVSALALNPVLFFVDTFEQRTTPYDVDKVRQHYDPLASYLEVDEPNAETLSFTRYVMPSSDLPGKLNLVIIHMESFAGFKVGVLGNKLNPTPAFDAIARESTLFTNFFVNASPTARSIFTMLTGIPDRNPVHSASRNPRIVSQHTLVNALKSYEKFYFLGGSATWGNIRGLMAHNIPGLHIYEEGDYDASRGDVWGVSDLALFERANDILKRQDKPFFAFIQTAGNHRPYTIPDDRRGFELADLDQDTLLENGFESLAAYNGLRFLDHSLGHFFKLARQAAYFKNTIFVMYGDHGVHAPTQIPWEQLLLAQYHVPLAIYAPGFIKEGRRIDTVASLVDAMPTYLSLMGISYLNTTLGRDLLASRPDDQHFALVPNGLLTDEFLLRVDPRGEFQLYRYRSDTPTVDLREQLPEEMARLRRLYEGLYETSKYLMHYNPPRPHAPAQPAKKTAPVNRFSAAE
ncbi:MAG: sulfatase-like hydrolase/transferase [Gammaproteobacteria bacterium]|jgi:phosphoglycerol transferase MdoB-like AlkP superfamily enzyme|nr:sulfatase-like hydrolase/transferase [Gammaproteobacteria bacterium]